jgi:hypothetical protein
MAERRTIFLQVAVADAVGMLILVGALIAGLRLHQEVLAVGLGVVALGWLSVVWIVFSRRIAALRAGPAAARRA